MKIAINDNDKIMWMYRGDKEHAGRSFDRVITIDESEWIETPDDLYYVDGEITTDDPSQTE